MPKEKTKRRQFLTIPEIAEILSCSKVHVYNLCVSGDFPNCYKFGGAKRVDAEDFEDYLEAKKRGMPYKKYVTSVKGRILYNKQ